MKRILVISPMPPLIGGISISSQRLVDRLREDGYDVDVYNTKFATAWLNNPVFLFLKIFLIPFYICFHRRYDIIHAHLVGVYRPYYFTLFKALYKGAKIVLTKHGDVTNILKSEKCVGSMRKADKVICVQKGDAVRVNAVTGLDHAVDIPAFILPSKIDDADLPQDVLDFVDGDSDKPLILFSGVPVLKGHWRDLYGFDEITWLNAQLRIRGLDFRMIIVVYGTNFDTDQKAFLEQMRARVENDAYVMWVQGRQFPLLPIMKRARVMVRPTKTDGDALSVREALLLNCDVVASDVSARPDGTILYHYRDDMLRQCVDVLKTEQREHVNISDNYKLIVNVYETL